jgi:tRNA(Ile)-lysidine synthase
MILKSILEAFDKLDFRNKKLLIAFSGGPDSVYLLTSLAEYYQADLNKHVSLCYINYHDSPYVDKEEETVLHFAKLYQVKLYKKDTHYEKRDKNFEEWAREYRYRYFKEVVLKEKLSGLVTAHQLTDKIETYLMQKKRNNLPSFYGLKEETTLQGLTIYRPLLSISKADIYVYLEDNKIPYYEDITNTNLKKQRNQIRKKVIPSLDFKSINSEIEKKNQDLEKLYQSFSVLSYPIKFGTYESYSFNSKRRLIAYLVNKEKLNLSQTRMAGIYKDIYSFLNKKISGEYIISKDLSLYRTKDFFFISSKFKNISYSYTYKNKERYSNKYFSINLSDPAKFNLKELPVTVRNYHQGDKIATDLPTKDVYKLLKKQGVPFYLIDSYPLFIQNKKIICVPFYKDILSSKVPLSIKAFAFYNSVSDKDK